MLTKLLQSHISFKCKWLAKLGLSRLKNYEPFPEGLFPEEHVWRKIKFITVMSYTHGIFYWH